MNKCVWVVFISCIVGMIVGAASFWAGAEVAKTEEQTPVAAICATYAPQDYYICMRVFSKKASTKTN